MDKILLVLGADKICGRLLAQVQQLPNLDILIDRSSSPTRLLRLILKGSLRITDVAKMGLAEIRRPGNGANFAGYRAIRSNTELYDYVVSKGIGKIYLFRAGLIINKKLIESGVDVLNVHCASLDGFGGLASIRRALEADALDQNATLHRVTTTIDEGEILLEKPYRLSKEKGYLWNEEIAYTTGVDLLTKVLSDESRRLQEAIVRSEDANPSMGNS